MGQETNFEPTSEQNIQPKSAFDISSVIQKFRKTAGRKKEAEMGVAAAESREAQAPESGTGAGSADPGQSGSGLKQAGGKLGHYYCEVGGELLAKPTTLGDLLESQGLPSTLVFCNNPSDTDFVEVLLKKRGIGATKLIGYVPPAKLARALERIASKEICAIVLTDIAARGIKLSDFTLVINYSVPTDADVYLHRSGLAPAKPEGEPQDTPGKVISIIAPLDIANFHYVRKAVELEFVKMELPTKEALFTAKVDNIRRQAADKFPALDEGLKTFAGIILENPDSRQIVSLLLHNTLEVIPQLNASLDKASLEREFPSEEEEDDRFQRGGGNRGRREGGRGGRDRGDRGDDRGDRRDRGDDRRDRGDDRRDRGDDRRDRGDRGGRDYRRGGRGGDRGDYRAEIPLPADGNTASADEYEGEGGRRGRRGSEGPRIEAPRSRDDRLYIGQGAASGLSEEKFFSLLSESCGLGRDNVKRFLLRDHYAFVDVPDEVSGQVVDKLGKTELSEGHPLFVRKAITIVAPREPRPEEESGEDSGSYGRDEGDYGDRGPRDDDQE